MAKLELPQFLDAGIVTVTNDSRAITGDSDTLANVRRGQNLIVVGHSGVWDVASDAVDDGGGDGDFTIIELWTDAPDTAQAYVSVTALDENDKAVVGSADAIGTFAGRSTYDAQSEGYIYISVDGFGSDDGGIAFQRVTATSGVWAIIEEPDDEGGSQGNLALNWNAAAKDPYIADEEKGDTEPLPYPPFYALCQADGVTASRSTSDATFSGGLKLTKTTGAGRMGFAWIVLASEQPELFDRLITLALKLKNSTGDDTNCAILSDTGTDKTPLDPVNDWTDPDLSAGNFFISGVTVHAVGTLSMAADEANFFSLVSDSNAARSTQGRLIFVVWNDASMATSATLEATELTIHAAAQVPSAALPQPEETVKVPVKQSNPALLTFASAPGYQTSNSVTELDPFPGEGSSVTLTVEAGQWFRRNQTVIVTNRTDEDQAFRMRVTEYSGTSLTGTVNKANGTDVNDDWVISVAPGVPSGSGAQPSSITYIGKATNTGSSTLTATLDSGTITEGDILVWADLYSTFTGANVPEGFTSIASVSGYTLATKIADGSEDGSTITGRGPPSTKTLACFRADVVSGIKLSVGSVNAGATAGSAPSNQTITASSGTGPLVKIAFYGVHNTGSHVDIDPRGWDTTADGEIELTDNDSTIYLESWLDYEINNSSPADTVISMQDEGTINYLTSCYIELSADANQPGDTVVFENDGNGNATYPNALLPEVLVGTVIWSGRTSPPTGTLECDGSAVSRTTYARLFDAIGTTFGTGDGSTTFNIPDLETDNRFIRAADGSALNVGDTQSHQLENHKHDYTTKNTDDSNTGGSGGLWRGTVTATTSNPVTGNAGGETRPNNIALLPCIVY